MTMRRFIDRRGWERWFDVPDPPPASWAIAEPPEVPAVLPDPRERIPAIQRRVFRVTLWRRPGSGRSDEILYSEDGMPLQTAPSDGDLLVASPGRFSRAKDRDPDLTVDDYLQAADGAEVYADKHEAAVQIPASRLWARIAGDHLLTAAELAEDAVRLRLALQIAERAWRCFRRGMSRPKTQIAKDVVSRLEVAMAESPKGDDK